jgi:hypothetical protein
MHRHPVGSHTSARPCCMRGRRNCGRVALSSSGQDSGRLEGLLWHQPVCPPGDFLIISTQLERAGARGDRNSGHEKEISQIWTDFAVRSVQQNAERGTKSMAKPKSVGVGNIKVAGRRGEIAERVKKCHERLRNRYLEIHGKVVDWVSHSFEEDSLFVTIRFMDKTECSLQFSPTIVMNSVDLSDLATGNFELIREYHGRKLNCDS